MAAQGEQPIWTVVQLGEFSRQWIARFLESEKNEILDKTLLKALLLKIVRLNVLFKIRVQLTLFQG